MTIATKGLDRHPNGSGRKPRTILWLALGGLTIFLVWANFAELQESTSGIGKIAPSSRAVVIQNLEGGILESIAVDEGETVERGQKLAQIEELRFRSTFEDLKSQAVSLRIALARLDAEVSRKDNITFDEDLLAFVDKIDVETSLFELRKQRLKDGRENLRVKLELAREHLKMVDPLIKQKAISAVEGIKLRREIANLAGQLSEMTNKFLQEAGDERAKLSASLASIREQMAQKRDALARTTLVSPVRGIVKNLEITTRGGVVNPGETIMEIVPLDDQLLVEARISPKDVAFLKVGQPASVQLTAYDYTIYGSIKGRLIHISPDTLVDDQNRDSEPFYLVKVKTLNSLPEIAGQENPIKPGMIANIHIETGQRTVLNYLIKPLLRGQTALQER